MKRALFIISLILSSLMSFGQKIRFSDSTNIWTVSIYDIGPPTIVTFTSIDEYLRDSTINLQTYKILNGYDFFAGYSVFIREDTILNKVFILINDTEQVYMDYNLNLGDTILPATFTHSTSKYYVDYLDTIIINGIAYKVWDLYPENIGSGFSYPIIEGIGCMYGPLYILNPQNGFSASNLTCFKNNGEYPNISGFGLYPSGFFYNNCFLEVDKSSQINQNVLVVPNPINESSKIVFPYRITLGTVIIVNDIGDIIARIPFQFQDELPIGDQIKVPGVYFYRVTDNITGETYSGKFVY